MRTRLIAFGNTLLSDDGAGIRLARAVRVAVPELEVVESEVGGLALLELLAGCERAVLLDVVKLPGHEPGELVPLALAEARCCSRLAGVHEVDLAGVLAIAERLGHPLPREILLFGIQGVDLTRFAVRLTPEIEAALPRLVDELLAAIDER
jgi:hydrogenase maturation protease